MDRSHQPKRTFRSCRFSEREIANEFNAGRFRAVEVLYKRNGEVPPPTAGLLENISASTTRVGTFRQDEFCVFALSDLDFSEISSGLEKAQDVLSLRAVSDEEPFAAHSVSVTTKQFVAAVAATTNRYSDCAAVPKLETSELVVETLERVTCVLNGDPRVLDNNGRRIGYDFLARFEFTEDAAENVFVDLRINGSVAGIAVPVRQWIKNGHYAAPSYIVEGIRGSSWAVFLVYGGHEQLEQMRAKLVERLDLPGADLAGLISPLPCGQYRLSKESAQMVEFDVPFGFYNADELSDVFAGTTSGLKVGA